MFSTRLAATRALTRGAWLVMALASARCGEDEARPPCDDWAIAAELARRTAQERADVRECSVDADCVRAYFRIRCLNDCGDGAAAVAGSAVPALRAEVEAIERRSCGDFERAGCPLIALPCVLDPNLPNAVCRGGRCELERVDEP